MFYSILSTALVQRGTLRKGDILVAGEALAKVRKMLTDKGGTVFEAKPGKAVEILGWKELPHAGDLILQAESEVCSEQVILVTLLNYVQIEGGTIIPLSTSLPKEHNSTGPMVIYTVSPDDALLIIWLSEI